MPVLAIGQGVPALRNAEQAPYFTITDNAGFRNMWKVTNVPDYAPNYTKFQ